MMFSPEGNVTPEESRSIQGNRTREESHSIRLAEYAALRDEITTFMTLQVQFISYSIGLGSAVAGLYFTKPSLETAAFFPLPFLIFGLLYGDAKARILRAANYIQNDLRPTLIDSADELMWESFIRKESTLKPFLSWAEKVRWALFLGPSLVPIILLIGYRSQLQHESLVGSLFTVEAILFFLVVTVMLKLDNYERSLLEKR
jgi:hypothetical protein